MEPMGRVREYGVSRTLGVRMEFRRFRVRFLGLGCIGAGF